MNISISPLFPVEVLNCMAEARPPTEAERSVVAKQIWTDSGPSRSAFGWGELPDSSPTRLAPMQAIDLALWGVP